MKTITKKVPNLTNLCGYNVAVFYPGVVLQCFLCRSSVHYSNSCPRKRKRQTQARESAPSEPLAPLVPPPEEGDPDPPEIALSDDLPENVPNTFGEGNSAAVEDLTAMPSTSASLSGAAPLALDSALDQDFLDALCISPVMAPVGSPVESEVTSMVTNVNDFDRLSTSN